MLRLALFGDAREIGDYLRLEPRLREERDACLVSARELSNHDWESGDFDAAVLCSQPDRSEGPAAAIGNGKHAFVATPLTNAEETGDLFAQSQKQNVRLMVGFSHRFLPAVQAVKQSLDSGQLGDPGVLRSHRWQPDARLTADLVADVDLAIWMFRKLPTEVYGLGRGKVDGDPGYLQIHLGFPAGGMALIDLCNSLPSFNGYFSFSVIGSSGAAYADDHHNQQLLFRGQNAIALKASDGDAARLAELKEFVDAIREQRQPAVTCQDARAALLVCDAVGESIETGRAARLVGERYEC